MDHTILVHHGIKDQKWGNRRYQYEDGSLTPEGRIHYGVGERRSKGGSNKIAEYKAKAKYEIKVAKAKAKAEAKLYKEKKRADDDLELKRIKANQETEERISKENERIARMERRTQKELMKGSEDSEENPSKLKTGLFIAGAALVTAGVGYLTYKYVKQGAIEGLAKETVDKGDDVVKAAANTPASEIINLTPKSLNNIGTTAKTTKAAEKAAKAAKAARPSYYFTPSGEYAKTVSRGKLFDKLFGPTTSTTVAKSAANKATQAYIKSGQAAYDSAKASSMLSNAMGTSSARKAANAARTAANRTNWENYIEKLRKVSSMKHGECMNGMILLHSYQNEGNVLCHHGIKGQKWGVRRYQYEDGTLTPEGKVHYGKKADNYRAAKDYAKGTAEITKFMTPVAATATAAGTASFLSGWGGMSVGSIIGLSALGAAEVAAIGLGTWGVSKLLSKFYEHKENKTKELINKK